MDAVHEKHALTPVLSPGAGPEKTTLRNVLSVATKFGSKHEIMHEPQARQEVRNSCASAAAASKLYRLDCGNGRGAE